MNARTVGVLLVALALAACNTTNDDQAGGSGGSGATGGEGGSGGSGDGGGGTGGEGEGGGGAGEGGQGGNAGEGGHGGETQLGEQVLGIVIDDRGAPFAGVSAVLNHDFASAQVTDAEGKFGFDEVELPYDLTLKLPSGDIVELRRLTRREPQVALFDNEQGLSRVSMSGTVTEATESFSNGDAIVVSTTGTDRGSIVADSPGTFSGELSWFGTDARTVDVVAVHVTPKPDGSFAYRAAGVLSDFTLEGGASVSGLQIELSSSPIATFQTRIDADFGAFDNDRNSSVMSFNLLGARFDLFEHFGGEETGLPTDTDVDLPVEGGRLVFSGADASGTLAMRVVTVTSAGTTSVRLPDTEILKMLAPEDDASDVSRLPELSWTAVPGAKSYWVQLEAENDDGPNQRHQYYLPGDVNRIALADFGSDEVQLAGSTTFSWTVFATMTDHLLDADAITDGRGMGAVRLFGHDDFFIIGGRGQSFTTAP